MAGLDPAIYPDRPGRNVTRPPVGGWAGPGPATTQKWMAGPSPAMKQKLMAGPGPAVTRRRWLPAPAQPTSFLDASINSRTAAQDLSNAAFSSAFSSISTMRSIPPAPITTGTPTYRSLIPYSPFR